MSRLHCFLCEFKPETLLFWVIVSSSVKYCQLLWRKNEVRHKLAQWPEEMFTVLTSLFHLACLLYKWLLGRASLSHFSLSFPFLSFPNFVLLHLPLEELQIRLRLLRFSHPVFTSQQLCSSSYLFTTLSLVYFQVSEAFSFAFPSITAWNISVIILCCVKFPHTTSVFSFSRRWLPSTPLGTFAVSSLLTCLSNLP